MGGTNIAVPLPTNLLHHSCSMKASTGCTNIAMPLLANLLLHNCRTKANVGQIGTTLPTFETDLYHRSLIAAEHSKLLGLVFVDMQVTKLVLKGGSNVNVLRGQDGSHDIR